MMYDYWNYQHGNSWGWIMMLLILLILMVGLVYFLSTLRKESNSDTALNLLKKRYANGDIDTKEYEERRKILEV
jgi:putative membrane protein